MKLVTIVLQTMYPATHFITKYIFSDIGYLKWLITAMIVDLVTGVAKAYSNGGLKAITSKGLRDTVNKCIQYGALLIITHVITHYEIGGEAVTNLQWINKLAMQFILLIEVKSVYENVIAISPSLDFVSVWWAKVVKNFPVKEIKSTKDEHIN